MCSLVATTVRVGLVLASVAAPLAAQDAPVTRDSITLVPGPQFSTTSWIRWLGTALFGARYRVVWNTPITLPVLDLAATAGGLQSLRNLADGQGWLAAVYARPDYIAALATSTPIQAHVKVDFELWGCPVSGRQVLAALAALKAFGSPVRYGT